MMIRLCIAAVLAAGIAMPAAAQKLTRGPYDRYASTSNSAAKLSSHTTEEACVAAVPSGTVQQCRNRLTVDKRATTPPPAVTWVKCATDPETCTFSGTQTVRFGVSDTDRYIDSPNRTSPVWCDISSFGGTATDPAPGVRKSCYVPSGTATPPPPMDVCPNLDGAQASVPAGMVKDAAGNCVPAPTTPPPSGTAAGPRVTTFTPSGPITATSGQVISGVRISNSNGACITIPQGVSNVVIRDSQIGPCGGEGNIIAYGSNVTIEYNRITNGRRGVFAHQTGGITTRYNTFDSFYGPHPGGKAVEYDYMSSGVVEGNVITGSNYPSDVLSVYESSNVRLVNNSLDVQISEPSGAALTMGDSTTGRPGANNYVAGNIIRQRGGVPAGVFGSNGNTVLERNCFTAGIQAYNYSGTFVGVTIRHNVINLAQSFVPDKSVISGWSTNVDGTDCSKVPQ